MLNTSSCMFKIMIYNFELNQELSDQRMSKQNYEPDWIFDTNLQHLITNTFCLVPKKESNYINCYLLHYTDCTTPKCITWRKWVQICKAKISITSLCLNKIMPDWAKSLLPAAGFLLFSYHLAQLHVKSCVSFSSAALCGPCCAECCSELGWPMAVWQRPSQLVSPCSRDRPSHPCTNVPFVMQMEAAFSAAQILNLLFRRTNCWSSSRPIVAFLLQ